MTEARPLFSHLLDLTDGIGLFEHSRYAEPRREHGYCVDDVARGLVVLSRQEAIGTVPFAVLTAVGMPDHPPRGCDVRADELDHAAGVYLRFLARRQSEDGRIVNRCDVKGVQHGQPGVEDCWGRALWGLGTAAARSRSASLAEEALRLFTRSAALRSPWPKAMAFAGLGAAEVLRVDSGHQVARELLGDVVAAVGRPGPNPAWPWPAPRLTYANAVLPDVLMAAGDCLGDDALIEQGLGLLGWLADVESAGGHLSVTPAGGRGRLDRAPGFDQQPIEAASLADAAARAYALTADPTWARAVERCAGWFFGANDSKVSLYDVATGGCCDGLQAQGRNENQGAESTLALISTLQHASRLAMSRR